MHDKLKKFTLDFLNNDVKKINKILKIKNLNVKSKSNIKFDPVTDIDLKINALLSKKIRSYFPKHNIKSEESNFIDNKSDHTWFLDPLDGTKNFIFGLNYYSILAGLNFKNKPIYSLIFFPKTKELYFSINNDSFYYSFSKKKILNLKKVIKYSSRPNKHIKILVNSIHTLKSKKIINFFKNNHFLYKISGADAMNFVLLSLNRADLLIESGLKDIDILPLLNFLKVNNIKLINWKKKNIIYQNNNSLIFYKNKKHNRMVIKKFLKIV